METASVSKTDVRFEEAARERAQLAHDYKELKNALFIIGIDISDSRSLNEVRVLIQDLKEREQDRKELKRGFVHALMGAAIASITGVLGYLWHLNGVK